MGARTDKGKVMLKRRAGGRAGGGRWEQQSKPEQPGKQGDNDTAHSADQ